MDALSQVLTLFRLKSYVSGAFVLDERVGFNFPKFMGIKCYAVSSGSCWLSVQSIPKAMLLHAGDCVLLTRGMAFSIATDLSLPRVTFNFEDAALRPDNQFPDERTCGCTIIGGHFLLTERHSEILLESLPLIVRIRDEADQETIRWSLDRMRKELQHPQLGGTLIGQQLAYVILIQALRLHLQRAEGKGVGWLFGLADERMRKAILYMHEHPAHAWTVQDLADRLGMSRTTFAQKFKGKVGTTPMDYLTRWRMLLAGDRLRNSDDSVALICSSLGYGTESAFSRTFRRVWGCSPREHRREPSARIGG